MGSIMVFLVFSIVMCVLLFCQVGTMIFAGIREMFKITKEKQKKINDKQSIDSVISKYSIREEGDFKNYTGYLNDDTEKEAIRLMEKYQFCDPSMIDYYRINGKLMTYEMKQNHEIKMRNNDIEKHREYCMKSNKDVLESETYEDDMYFININTCKTVHIVEIRNKFNDNLNKYITANYDIMLQFVYDLINERNLSTIESKYFNVFKLL